jgi:hypothetical protein
MQSVFLQPKTQPNYDFAYQYYLASGTHRIPT